jgi:hypothetical protein
MTIDADVWISPWVGIFVFMPDWKMVACWASSATVPVLCFEDAIVLSATRHEHYILREVRERPSP